VNRDVFDPDEIRAAFDGLAAIDLARLRRAGRLLALGLACEADDLIGEAVAATLSGARTCPRRMALVPFLIGAMRSIASATRSAACRAEPAVSLDATGTDGRPLVVPIDPEPTAESRLLAAEDKAERIVALENLFADDEQALLMLWATLELTPKEEIMTMNDLDDTAYATIRRRMRRAINGRYPAGWSA
jgi:RNA polymerase sigma-70 factor (ECF subfamily)